jgi:hypothetical protein
LNEIVIDAIFLTDAVNITLSDYMEHEVDMTHVLSTDVNGDRDADMQTNSGVLHQSMIALMVLGLATLVIVVILLLIWLQRQRFQRCAWNTAGRPLQRFSSIRARCGRGRQENFLLAALEVRTHPGAGQRYAVCSMK